MSDYTGPERRLEARAARYMSELHQADGAPFTVREVAEMFGFAPKTIREEIAGGQLKGYRLNGDSDWRIPFSEVKAWAQRIGAIPQTA